jgi:glycerate kinase
VRILVCPDKFAGTLTAAAAASAIAAGWSAAAPYDPVTQRPLADGGPGFLDALAAGLGGVRRSVETSDPLGRPVRAQLLDCGPTVYVEAAEAVGLHLLTPAERDPTRTSSYGLGALLLAAGPAEIVVGLGGSATNDAGAGLLAALGAVPVSASGEPLPPGGLPLAECARLIGSPPKLSLFAASDVDSPLTGPDGASFTYGPQKGARPHDLPALDAALGHFAEVMERDLAGCPTGLATLPGSGAAGGLGAALLALGARRVAGFDLVRSAIGLDAALDECDLVITGEGSFDEQSLHGKVVAGVAAAALRRRLPCLVLAGRVEVGERAARSAGVTRAYALVDELGSVPAALSAPAEGLRGLAERIAGEWRH